MSSTADKVAVAILTAAREVGGEGWQQVAFDVAYGKISTGGRDFSVSRTRSYAAHALNLMTDWSRHEIVRLVGGRGACETFFSNIKLMRSKPYWNDDIVDRVKQAIFAMPDDAPKEDTEIPAARDPTGAAEEERLQRIGGLPNVCREAIQDLSMRAPTPRPAVTPGKRSAIELLRQAVENTQRMTPPEESR